MYEEELATFLTPNGRRAWFTFRHDTNDWNTITSVMADNDEYQLAGLRLEGTAVDVGASLGPVSVALLVDNPGLQVLAVEPVPGNIELIRTNADLNHVADRLTIFEGSVGNPGRSTSEIRFGYRGDANLEHHAFVGNTSLAYDTGGDVSHESLQVPTLGLGALLDEYGIAEPSFLKCDCEGAEWAFFSDTPALKRLSYIIGEAHPVRGHRAFDIVPMLEGTHDVSLHGENQDPGPCGFTAVRR